MGFMDDWKKWSEKQWKNWGSKLQPTYKKISDWDTPGWVKKAGERIWDLLDDVMKKRLYEFVMETLKKFDEKFAKELIETIMNKLFNWLKTKKPEDNQ